jgi:hypothetical protein
MRATLRARLAAATTLPECLPCWRAAARRVRPLEARLSRSTVGRSECDTTTDSTEEMCAGSPRGAVSRGAVRKHAGSRVSERRQERRRRRKSRKQNKSRFEEDCAAALRSFAGPLQALAAWGCQARLGSRDAKGPETSPGQPWRAIMAGQRRRRPSPCLTQGSRLTGPSPSTTGPPNHHCPLDPLDARIGAAPPRARKQPHVCPEHDRCRCRCRCRRADDKTPADPDS